MSQSRRDRAVARPALLRRLPSLACALALLSPLGHAPAVAAANCIGGPTALGNFTVAPGLPGRFGQAIATGDFNGDGRTDVAIGSPQDSTGGANAGSVAYYRRFNNGLQLVKRYIGPPGSSAGWSLAAGDFDGDGDDEIAVGRVNRTVGGASGAGDVVVIDWDNANSTFVEVATFDQSRPEFGETAEPNDGFAWVLAAGDLTGDGIDDLAIGVPREDHTTAGPDAGLVHVIYGFDNLGLAMFGAQTWKQGTGGLAGVIETGDSFGWRLAIGDFDNDGEGDLAIGILNELVGTKTAGGVAVIYGTTGGLNVGGNDLFTEGVNGVPGPANTGDWMGQALATGDFDDDGIDDLAIGVPGAQVGAIVQAGVVITLRGSGGGLSTAGATRWTASSLGGTNAVGDELGTALASGDFDDDDVDDLVIGMPWAVVTAGTVSGKIAVVLGSAAGLLPGTWRSFTSKDLACGPSPSTDEFAGILATGDFDLERTDDIFVGIPGRDVAGVNHGLVQVLRGRTTIFDDDLESANFNGWNGVWP